MSHRDNPPPYSAVASAPNYSAYGGSGGPPGFPAAAPGPYGDVRGAAGGAQPGPPGPPGNAMPVSTVELSVSAKNLVDMDVFSKSDPMCVVYIKESTAKDFR